VFFQTSSALLLMNFLMPPLAAVLMEINPWIPIFLGAVLEVIPLPLFVFVPETLHHHKRNVELEPHAIPTPKATSEKPNWLVSLQEIGSLFTRDWRIPGLAVTFLVHMYSLSGATLLLLQYVSTRYSITFSKATFIISLRSGFSIAVLLILLPWISHCMATRFGFDTKRKDLTLARASVLFASLGWILIALAPSLPLFVVAVSILVLGGGFSHLVRSLLTSLVLPGEVAKLYTILSVLDTLGMMGGSALFAWLFKVGLNHGDAGLGLPFLCLGILHVVFAGIVFCVRIRSGDRGEVEEDELFEP